MIIKGLQKLTLLDFPRRTACTVFTGGCNFRCPFCHNASLVTDVNSDEYTEEAVFAHLRLRKNVLDGVAVTGGEPLLQKDIERFLYELKEEGFAVKLDTNGSFPEKLRGILELGLADYVAMDVKNHPDKYGETVGIKDFDVAPIRESVDILRDSAVDYEFRTTVTENFHTVEDIEKLACWISHAPRYYLQNFVDSGNLIDSSCRGVSRDVMSDMLTVAQKHIPGAALRGI